ncbi:hypothetical protein JI664_14820 [Rhodobacter sp. NTK016B]|uniref:hypothetical protein n=1 Tax=Rhodobacter sp. NTK016B TaxID=2759676 RepID=UPI001A8C16F3|nr:hypothetical protein [Rhodobacter sp. NTK016B]MBN8293245.1 hypothetical protein [Rhodobacter sp. NTK016B]
MSDEQVATVGPDHFLKRENSTPAEFIDSSIAAEAIFPEMSAVIVRLWDCETQSHEPGSKVPLAEARQFRMSARTARILAQNLLAVADEIEGKGHRRQ